MTINPRYIIYHDLIGYDALSRSKSKHQNTEFSDIGQVVDETRNMLITEKETHIKKYVKKDYIFRFKIKEKEGDDVLVVEVDGDKIVGLPINRLRSLRKKRR
jgi:RNase P/RNase MRP subunit p29